MCGLVAILSKTKSGFFQGDKTIFYQMLISDMFRGMDSTGSYSVNRHGNVKWIKDASPAPFFINKKEMATYMSNFISDYHIVVGHNRKATMGNVVSDNAHPFVEGNICLVHNGTLSNHKKLADTTVDSHAICHHINEFGYKSMFKNIDGAYALIWYNIEEKTLYFARNSERPLYIAETDTRIFLASEEKMLDWILDRNNITKYTIEIVPTDKVFKFNMDTRKLECETKPKKEVHSNQNGQNWNVEQWYSPGKNNKFQRKSNHQSNSTSSNLSLVHSSEQADMVPISATINDYASGEIVQVRAVDFDTTENATKVVFETLDQFRAVAAKFFPHDKYSQKDIDAILNAERMQATIQNVTSKRGNITLWLSSLIHVPVSLTARGGVQTTWKAVEEAGKCCYMCGTVFDRPQDIEFAEIRTDSAGDITYMTCEFCADSVSHIGQGVVYAGNCDC